jgi:polysaccharide export outer membrane protein
MITDPIVSYLFSAKKSNCNFLTIAGILAFICVYNSSCVPSKNLKYFNNLSDSGIVHLPHLEKPAAIIMVDDILEIKIAGANPETAALLNTYSTSTNVANSPSQNSGYLVDNKGDIEFPIMGKIRAAGLSREEFRDRLKERVSKYLKDPLITIKFSNFRFTVLGEVRIPGSFLVPQERVTVLEAMGLAGDMTSYGRRASVRVIRDSSGVREVGQLDFTDKSVFTSKYYYLQRNDVVYVEAEKTKRQFEDISRVSTIVATMASLIALAITVLRK